MDLFRPNTALAGLPLFELCSDHFVSFRFVSFRFVSFRFVSFRFVSFRFVSFRFVSFRFVFARTIVRRVDYIYGRGTTNSASIPRYTDEKIFDGFESGIARDVARVWKPPTDQPWSSACYVCVFYSYTYFKINFIDTRKILLSSLNCASERAVKERGWSLSLYFFHSRPVRNRTPFRVLFSMFESILRLPEKRSFSFVNSRETTTPRRGAARRCLFGNAKRFFAHFGERDMWNPAKLRFYTERYEKENKYLQLREQFVPIPRTEPLTGKFYAKHDTISASEVRPEYVDLIEKRFVAVPRDLYPRGPPTVNMEYGWFSEPLPPTTDPKLRFPRKRTDFVSGELRMRHLHRGLPVEKFTGIPFVV
ncbi:uncharacterized protein LOC143144150 [Ptiloglossa arizonensis]|uniref:uncharacterized protein LOC143144150 n=1 Tax=Ptiloglossa arizonensis TaxID=3350558 RepID=UPI003F9FA7D6